MYILTRYVVWEVLKFFVAALLALTLVVTLAMGIQKGLSLGLTPAVMLRAMPFMLPEMLGITIPVAMLFAVSSVFGRMAGANEIVAIKSLGISPMVVVWPVLELACLLSLGTVCMYEIAATWCKPNVIRIASESVEEIVYSLLRTNHSYVGPPDHPQFSITVKNVEGRTLVQPQIIILAQPGQPRVDLTAERAELSTDMRTRQLTIECSNSEFNIEGQGSMYSAEPMPWSVPIIVPAPPRYHRDWVAMRDVAERVAEREVRKRQLEALRDARKALGDAQAPEDDEIAFCRTDILQLRAEPYRRWSNGFTCLCFALIGTPVAMLRRHADVLTIFFTCFLPILAVYYPLLMFSDDLSTSGTLPPIVFWMGNVLLFGVAVLLLRRIIKH